MLGIIFDMIGVRDKCQHGDAIPISQQIAECGVPKGVYKCFRISPLNRKMFITRKAVMTNPCYTMKFYQILKFSAFLSS